MAGSVGVGDSGSTGAFPKVFQAYAEAGYTDLNPQDRPTALRWYRKAAEKGVADAATLARYRDAWDHAADRTPHGRPIELRAEDFAD